jgi:hypothetical protein
VNLNRRYILVRKGERREAFLVDGEYCDALSMAIVRRPG